MIQDKRAALAVTKDLARPRARPQPEASHALLSCEAMLRCRTAFRVGGGVALGCASALLMALALIACLPNLTPDLCGNGYVDVSAGEACDPGPNANPGCSACSIVCVDTDKGATAYLDPTTKHCYFTSKSTKNAADGRLACTEESAHPVTFVDDYEVTNLASSLFPKAWAESARYWVGLARQGSAGPFTAEANTNLEPGWNAPADCPGCFAYKVTSSTLPSADGGAEAGPVNAVVGTNLATTDTTIREIGSNAKAEVLCEREPVGSHATSCFQGSYCFEVPETSPSGKRYVYNPTGLSPDAAAQLCRSLVDGATASLVVLTSRREREQIVYELTQLAGVGGGPPPAEFWIGLSTPGGLDAWVWEDGEAPSASPTGSPPAIWGNHQPLATARARAFINLIAGYDDGLAYAYTIASDDVRLIPSVCQY